MMPHLAEECWQVLGNSTILAEQAWPQISKELIIEDEVTIAVQINGKRRAEMTISKNADKVETEKAALQIEAISSKLEDLTIRKVIVVPGRIVNIVAS